MARKLRIEYPGAVYHVMNRGDRRESIFLNEKDRELFLETLGEACAKTGWEVHAFCLMGNHFHLVVETPRANLVAGMKWFLGTYTSRFNRRHRLFGHLFSGRYKALIVDGSGNGYLKTVCDYVHLNPVRAGLLNDAAALEDYAWSSFPMYLKARPARPEWLRVDRLLGEHRVPKDSAAGREEFRVQMEARRREGNEAEWKAVRRGWALGSEAFRRELLEAMEKPQGASHYGAELKESDEAKARRIIEEDVRQLKFPDLTKLKKGAEEKVRIAARLRSETAVPLKWVAKELGMGSVAYVAEPLSEWRKK